MSNIRVNNRAFPFYLYFMREYLAKKKYICIYSHHTLYSLSGSAIGIGMISRIIVAINYKPRISANLWSGGAQLLLRWPQLYIIRENEIKRRLFTVHFKGTRTSLAPYHPPTSPPSDVSRRWGRWVSQSFGRYFQTARFLFFWGSQWAVGGRRWVVGGRHASCWFVKNGNYYVIRKDSD